MPRCHFDHLVVAAASLEAGVAHVEESLGVSVPDGGRHPLMGTHNCLMQLGREAFLEIIAIDPEAPTPSRPRWYALDDAEVQARIAERPRLLTWVVRTDDIETAAAASPILTGTIEEGRRGDLVWHITIPDDGSMPEGGLFPTLIQWPESLGPEGAAPHMADLGCRLESLTVAHPEPERLEAALAAIGADGLAEVQQSGEPGLAACIITPHGARELI